MTRKSFLDQRLAPHYRTFWFRLSFVAPLYFGLIALGYQLLGPEYVVQDDARQHVVWMQQFVDPQLFAGDAIANYYLTIAPPGYKGLYWGLAQIGIEPLLTAKLLPLILALITTYFAYKLALKILPIPLCGFLATLILNQQIWLDDELISATPRAFYYPLFTIFLYCVTQRDIIPCLVIIALQGLFYAPAMLLSVAILSIRLLDWRKRQLTRDRSRYLLWFAGCLVAALVILFLLHRQADVGPAVTALQMRRLPEFGLHGRHEYFGVNPIYFWFQGRSGLNISWFPASILMGLSLPALVIRRCPFTQKLTPHIAIIYQSLMAALSLYILAHVLLFELYYPSRYTYHSLRVVLALAAGISLTILLKAGWSWLQYKRQTHLRRRDRLLMTFVGLLIAIELLVPALPPVFLAMEVLIEGQSPELYAFLAQQPRDTVVATLAPEGDNLGAFAQRSTLVGREFALAFHPQYHRIVQARIADLLAAQYGTDPSVVRRIIDQYSIDFFLIENSAFTPEYLLRQDWLIHRSDASFVMEAIHRMQTMPADLLFPKALALCGVRSTQSWTLMDTQCLSQFLAASSVVDRPVEDRLVIDGLTEAE